MSAPLIPEYLFDFGGGVSALSNVKRRASWFDPGHSDTIEYEFDDLSIASVFSRNISLEAADLIDIAVSSHVADRLAKRQTPNDRRAPVDRWHRKMHVVIPVRLPEFWSSSVVCDLLEELMHFLTGDQWSFQFRRRHRNPRNSEAQLSLFPSQPRRIAVALQSDGLDSLFGVDKLLNMPDVEIVAPVTVVTNCRIRDRISAINQELREFAFPHMPAVDPAAVRLTVSSKGRPRDDRESSQRVRSFLYLACGAALADTGSADRLYVCENGIGALNLPMTPDHWGARASKPMHPITLAHFSKIASMAFRRSFEVINLGLFSTKGELADGLSQRYTRVVRRTISCDRAVYMRLGASCGNCTSCLLRQSALSSSRFAAYQFDRLLMAAPGRDLFPSFGEIAMERQIETIRTAITSGRGFAGLEEVFPELFESTMVL